jgi:transcription antitermination factor NusA-like protein
VPAECIVCFSARVGRTVQLNPTEEVLIAISQEVPESLTGDIEVVSIAREPSVVSKVLIRSDRLPDPIRICLGDRKARLRAVQAALNSPEVIDFIEWAPDIKRNVASSLVPLRQDDIASIWIAPDSLSAKVYVKSTEAAHRAVGTDGVNLRIAESLLGLHIDLETKDSSTPPEDELLEILRYRVPEIEDGRIQVIRLQRHVGRASKVAVSSAQLPDPVRRCIGQAATTAQAISRDLNGEHVTFVEWRTDNLADVIRGALHPARPQDITEVQVDPAATTANVSIRGANAMALAIGRDGDNVRLAERLCGVKINLRQTAK